MIRPFFALLIPIILLACTPAGSPQDPIRQYEAPPRLPPYADAKSALETVRARLGADYTRAATAEKQAAVLKRAGDSLATLLVRDMVPHWLGTDWDFYGVTQVPGEGSIACGYFITTLLRDCGFQLERATLAQQAASNIMKSLAPGQKLDWYSDLGQEAFAAKARTYAPGLYILGLDLHVGFLEVKRDGAWFVHSSYLDPGVVVREDVGVSAALGATRVYVVGKLSTNAETMHRWVAGERFVTVK